MNIVILGAGAWGTALAISLAARHRRVTLWTNEAAHAGEMMATRLNQRFLASGAWLRVEDNAGARGWAHGDDVRRLDLAPAPSRD